VEEHGEKLHLQREVQVKFNVDAIFGNLLWRQINKPCCFCIHLTAWLFFQWRKGEGKYAIYNLLTACIYVAPWLFIVKIRKTWPTVGRQITDRLPTRYRQLTDRLPTEICCEMTQKR